MNKLIIIGNGYDLYGELHSKFSQFFEASELPLCKQWVDNTTNVGILKDLSFISLILYNAYYREDEESLFHFEGETRSFRKTFCDYFNFPSSYENWMNVEECLNNLLRVSYKKPLLQKHYQNYFGYKYAVIDRCICENDTIIPFFRECRSIKGYSGSEYINDFYHFVFAELKLFEDRFAKYLNDEISAHNSERAKALEVVGDELIKPSDTGIVLNFNYTHFVNSKKLQEINVHGSLENNIIIGINYKDILQPEIVKFTKTFRKLKESKNNIKVLRPNIDEIIIYGHSLGEQDYSYFQSIFDYANIYSSNTRVRFIYSDYFIKAEADKKARSTDMSSLLFRLLELYGETLSNKDNGRNLIHKMLLEGRLSLELNNFGKVNKD